MCALFDLESIPKRVVKMVQMIEVELVHQNFVDKTEDVLHLVFAGTAGCQRPQKEMSHDVGIMHHDNTGPSKCV